MKDIKAKDLMIREAKVRVEEFVKKFLKENECVYPSDVADALELDYELVREVFCLLEKENKVCQKSE